MTKPTGPTDASLFAFTAFRRRRSSFFFTGVHVAGLLPAMTLSVVALLVFVLWFPHTGDPLPGMKVFLRAMVLCFPALLFSFWAQVTAARAALVGDEKLTARARSRQVAVSLAIILGCACFVVSLVVNQADELHRWLQAFLFTTLFGVYALTLLKDQIEDAVLVGRLWRDYMADKALSSVVPIGKWAETTCIGRSGDPVVVTAYAAAWAKPLCAVWDSVRERFHPKKAVEDGTVTG